MKILNLVVTHLAPEQVTRHLALAEAYTPGVPRLIAYGGPHVSFDALAFPDKFLLEDPSLRGPVINQCFNELFPKTWRWAQEHAAAFDFIHVTEYDHLILNRNYFEILEDAVERSGCDFLGKNCGLKANSNWMHLFRYRDDPVLLDYLRRISVREDKTAICGTLGNGFTLSRRALQAWAEAPTPPPFYNEVLFPTLTHHLGFKIGDIGAYCDLFRHVRWGPLWTETEIRDLQAQGAPCCHPFKDIDAAQRILLPGSVEQ